MHRSRLAAICLDVPDRDRERSEQFWAGAVGRTAQRATNLSEYTVFGDVQGHRLLLQSIGTDAARIHLDIHTDDRDAEVKRLVALGAIEVASAGDWVVLRDPAGLLLCVVPVPSDDPTLSGASRWT
jgi:hypothetical protein